jgi:hypothetical protein
MMACRTGCPTQDHASWGECARSANLRIAYAASARGLDATAQKKWDKELGLYARARSEGIQPNTTRTKDIQYAMSVSDKRGSAFDAADPTKGLTHG